MTKLFVTAHYQNGREKFAELDPEDAVSATRDLCFRLASSGEIVSFTVTKLDLVERIMDGRLKLKGGEDGARADR